MTISTRFSNVAKSAAATSQPKAFRKFKTKAFSRPKTTSRPKIFSQASGNALRANRIKSARKAARRILPAPPSNDDVLELQTTPP